MVEIKYFLSSFISPDKIPITFNEKEQLEKNSKYLMHLTTLSIFYHNTFRNLNSLIEYLGQKKNTMSLNEYDEKNIFADYNLYLSNLLASFYSMIEFIESNFNSTNVLSELYDTHFEYRLFYELRKIITHEGIIVKNSKTQFSQNALVVSAIIKKIDIIDSKRCNNRFKNELQQSNDNEFDLFDLCKNFKKTLEVLLESIISKETQNITSSFMMLADYKHKVGRNNEDCFLMKDDKPIWSLVKVLNIVLERVYFYFLNGIDQQELILLSSNTKSLFLSLCYIYFGVNGAIPKFVKA
jgi:hypothetical protein